MGAERSTVSGVAAMAGVATSTLTRGQKCVVRWTLGLGETRGELRICRSRVHGLPTKVVTLWASSVALKRALLTVMGLFEARLSVAEVTHGVMLQGTTPET